MAINMFEGARRIAKLLAVFSAAGLATTTLPGCTQSTESQLATCRMDALKTFFQFREKNELGIRWPPTTGELDYVELCMKSRGFELDVDKMRKANPDLKADAGLRDILYSDKANWK